jgi:hypothetical protein
MKIEFSQTATAAEIRETISTAYARLFWADKSKRFEFILREAEELGASLKFGNFGEQQKDDLRYGEVWEKHQGFDSKRERAYLEPYFSGDVGMSEVVEIKQVKQDDYNGSAD